jgi:hypothetical protein
MPANPDNRVTAKVFSNKSLPSGGISGDRSAPIDHLGEHVTLEELRVLTRISLAAVQAGLFDEAYTVAEGLYRNFPDYIAVAMTYGTVCICTNRSLEAYDIFRRLATENPLNESVLCSYAMLLKELGKGGWREIATNLVVNTHDEVIKGMAKGLIGHSTNPILKNRADNAFSFLRFK